MQYMFILIVYNSLPFSFIIFNIHSLFFASGTNVAGEIVEIGQVKDFKVGDKVLAKLNHQVF